MAAGFVRNAWYIAALSSELPDDEPLARTLLGTAVVLLRCADGRPVALEDRCPHRFAPLSLGRRVGDAIQCGYHGMTFDLSGRCIANPVCPTVAIPASAAVGTFPVQERHRLIWIWPGDPARADPAGIPDYFQYDDAQWTAVTHHMRVDAHYLLLVDNLMDLSHIAFVHADILGNDDVVDQQESQTISGEGRVSELRVVRNGRPIPVWQQVLGHGSERVDLWMDIHWSAVSNIVLDVGSTPTGQSRDAGAGIVNLDCLTPETATSTHYFYGHARQYAPHDESVSRFWSQSMQYAFAQDRRMVEAVQQRMGTQWNLLRMNPAPLINPTDRAALLVRRKIEKLRHEEAPAHVSTDTQATA